MAFLKKVEGLGGFVREMNERAQSSGDNGSTF
jgi:hypothetical protein